MRIRIAFLLPFGVWLVGSLAVLAQEPKAAELNRLRLYVPIPQFEERFGKDADPVAKYVKALQKRTAELLGEEPRPKAKGLLIAVGIKANKKTRVWCEAVEGEIPAKLLQRLEKELPKIEGVELQKAPAGFAMEMKLFGQKPSKYPEFPEIWLEAAKKAKTLLVPPDELFQIIWPD